MHILSVTTLHTIVPVKKKETVSAYTHTHLSIDSGFGHCFVSLGFIDYGRKTTTTKKHTNKKSKTQYVCKGLGWLCRLWLLCHYCSSLFGPLANTVANHDMQKVPKFLLTAQWLSAVFWQHISTIFTQMQTDKQNDFAFLFRYIGQCLAKYH